MDISFKRLVKGTSQFILLFLGSKRMLSLFSPWYSFMDSITTSDNPNVDKFMREEFNPFYDACGNYKDLHTKRGRLRLLLLWVVVLSYLMFHIIFAGVSTLLTYSCNMIYSCLLGYICVNGIIAVIVFVTQFTRRVAYAQTYYLVMTNFVNYDFEVESESRKRVRVVQKLLQKYVAFIPFVILLCDFVYIAFNPDVHCKGRDLQDTIFPAYYPFQLNGIIALSLASFLQIFYIFCILWLGCWGFFFFINICINGVLQSKRLIESVNRIEERAIRRMSKVAPGKVLPSAEQLAQGQRLPWQVYKNQDFINAYIFCLKENIRHHQLLISFQYHFQQSVEIPLGTFLGLSSIVLAILLLLLSDTFFGSFIVSVALIVLTLAGVYTCSMVGQMFSDLAEELRVAIFQTNWPYSDKKISSLIKTFMEMTQKPLRPCVLGIIHYDMPAFLSVLNTAYSYWNFLRLVNSLGNE